MIKRKSKFLTFCFAMVPGAGHMYIGFMKLGVSIMASFFLLCFFSTWLSLGPLIFLTPVLWFYSFFDVLNKNSMRDEDFYAQEDRFLFDLDFSSLLDLLQGKFRKILALCLIFIGCSLILSNIGSVIRNFLPYYFYDAYYYFFNRVPQLVIAVFIILAGIYLIRGKNLELTQKYGSSQKYESDEFMNDAYPKDDFVKADFLKEEYIKPEFVKDDIEEEPVNFEKQESAPDVIILEPQILESIKEDVIKEAGEHENS